MYGADACAELREQSNRLGVQFVLTELEMALSFLDVADGTSNLERQQRLFENGKKAHHTIQRFIPRLIFSASEASIVNRKLQLIRARLKSHGFGLEEDTSAGP